MISFNLNETLQSTLPKIMGILNITPDSFSDGGQFSNIDHAVKQAYKMVEEGADIIDIGGESTRPGAKEVPLEKELQRVIPVIKEIQDINVPISIDTSKPEVMLAAAEAGATLINDVCALQGPGALETVSRLKLPVCLMHMQGSPRTMQKYPQYNDVIKDIGYFFQQRIDAAEAAGIESKNILLDPGFGFGKMLQHNIDILNHLEDFKALGFPLLIGLSRKKFLGELTGTDTKDRMLASVIASMVATQNGAQILRVHDVAETKQMLNILKVVE